MRALLLWLVVGCYGPTPPQGVPCGDGDSCPTGQRCFGGTCSTSAPSGVEPDSMPAGDGSPPNPMSFTFGERSDAIADTMTDTFLASDLTQAGNNFGAHPDLHLTGGSLDPVLIRVDLSSILPTTNVKSATLILEVTFSEIAPGTKVNVFAVNESWTEGSGDHSPGIANQLDRHPNVAWSAEGAAPPSRGAMPVSTTVVGALIDVGSDLEVAIPAGLVQAWVADPSSNNGVALIVAQDFYSELGSSEAENELDRPVLRVELD